jgi:hypothetical protein
MPSLLVEGGKFASLLLFVALGIRVARATGQNRRRAINTFLAYTIAINLLSGITQFDNWPFSSNTLAAGRGNDDTRVTWLLFRGVDQQGREWALDPQTWSPVFDSILQFWLQTQYPRLPPDQRREADRFLVARANATRAALSSGRRIGFERLIGPFNIGYWWRLPRETAVPKGPFRAVRVYEAQYTNRELLRAGHFTQERLILEMLE